ncbi:MAG: oxygenase MpaB family protein, partial [Nannocystaceae bacterium]
MVDRLVPYLWRGDPLADAVIADGAAQEVLAACQSPDEAYAQSVQNLARSVCEVPAWVDWPRIARAGELFYRAGVLGGLVLGLRSLIAGYAAPDGNKPLVFSGRLAEQTPRRVAETSRFVTEACRPGGMRVGASGWAITVRVRLMHAKVRALISQTGRWQPEAWGLPINQHDMLATNLLFSSVFVDGLRILGLAVSNQDAADYMHLWRYIGWVMGVEPALLPADWHDATRLEAVIQATQRPPDDDSRALVDALIQA